MKNLINIGCYSWSKSLFQNSVRRAASSVDLGATASTGNRRACTSANGQIAIVLYGHSLTIPFLIGAADARKDDRCFRRNQRRKRHYAIARGTKWQL